MTPTPTPNQVETFTACTTAELRQGKKAWEGKSDKSLVDYLSSELGSSYDGLRKLLRQG